MATGDVVVVRYADDLVVGFENRMEAERFLEAFRERLAKFGLRKLTVPPKIVFPSQESCPEVVGEALNLGALGYVHKTRAGSDLLPAIDAVLRGKRFVSKGLEADAARDGVVH